MSDITPDEIAFIKARIAAQRQWTPREREILTLALDRLAANETFRSALEKLPKLRGSRSGAEPPATGDGDGTDINMAPFG